MNKTQVGAAALAAAAGAAALGGTAMAGYGAQGAGASYAVGGKGGTATNNCLNIGIPVLSGLGIGGQGSVTGAQCNATANGGNATAY